MQNKKKLLTVIGIALILVIGIVIWKLVDNGIKEREEEQRLIEEEIKQNTVEETGVDVLNKKHLRDVDALYKNDDPYDVITMYLTVSTGNSADSSNHTWQEVNQYSAYYYDELGIDRYKVEGLLQVGDESGPLPGKLGYGQELPNATVQIRGQTSTRESQKNYKIALKDNSEGWNGQKTIALNKHRSEGMRFRNKLCFDLLREIPQIMSLRTQFVHLYVKDNTAGGSGKFEDYGIYTQVEQLNKTALRAHGLDKNGQLYKINFCEFYEYDAIKKVDDPDYNEAAFNEILESKGSNDHTKLLQLLKDVNDYTMSSDELIEKCVDSENVAYWMAFMMLIGNCDTQNRNMYIYSPLNGTKWYIYPWDCDGSLLEYESKIDNWSDFGDWERGVSNYWGNVLFKRMLQSEKFRKELDDAVEDIYKNYLTREKLAPRIEKYSAVTKPYLYRMPDIEFARLKEPDYEDVKSKLIDEIENNYKRYKKSLVSPMPFFVNVPEISGDKMTFGWNMTTDFQNTAITYHTILARDYNFTDKIYEADVKIPGFTLNQKLPPGQYFLHVDARNEAGNTTNCFDVFNDHYGKIYGTFCFYVKEDGKCVSYDYEEADE